jgi:polysaccharide export outer membrane protein
VRATIATVVLKIRRFTSFRGVLVFLGMLGIAALCVAQAAKPILTPTPEPATPASTTPAPATTPAAPPHLDASYVIGADDVLQITVWKEQTLSGSFPVRPDGMISMVLLGDVKAAGLTTAELTTTLTTLYKKYVQDPVVTVAVTQDTSQRIFVVGEVGRVGPVQITPGMTVLQAISTAGGPTPYARKNRIYILRGPQGKQEKIPFNYKAAIRGDNSQDIVLKPNDTVVVP